MSIPINDTLVPRTTGYALMDDADVAGGLHVVADIAARDAIPPYNLKVGMVAYTQAEGKYWVLTSLLPVWIERLGNPNSTFSMSALGQTGFSLGEITDAAGDFTFGDLLVFTNDFVVTGGRFFWPGGHGALVVKVTLWDLNGVAVASVNVNVDAAGLYNGIFATAQPVVAHRPYRISVWEMSGARNIYVANGQMSVISGGLYPLFFLNERQAPNYFRFHSVFAAGDAFPTSTDINNILGLVDPIF